MNNRGHIVYVVDDDVSVCRALAVLLKSHGFKVKAFTCSEDFLTCKHPNVPSCLVLDIQLPDINGLALQEEMAARKLDIPIIFITGHGDIPMSVKGIKAGAVDFLTKPFDGKKLLSSVGKAIDKNKERRKVDAEIARIQRYVKSLTPREYEVMRWVITGILNKQIASKLKVAEKTIKVHRGRVMHKMQAISVADLVRLTQKCGIIPPKK